MTATEAWRRIILDVLDHYHGAFTYQELWEETPGSEIERIHEAAARQARERQGPAAFQAWILARNPYVGGMKQIDVDDFYYGLARIGLDEPPFPEGVMRGIDLAVDLEGELGRLLLAQRHLDLLGPAALMKWWSKKKKKRRG